ncbi:MAG: hypothetical protein M3279_05685 [Actinomycetota bacterium]|nr:hypothetical protein [Actinomycetota bacterium]
MVSKKTIRTLSVIASAALIVGAFTAGPADAKKKKKKPKACATYVPGELGADQPVTVVTDAATAEAPVEVELDTGPGVGFTSPDGPQDDTGDTSHVFTNVQVDSAARETGLYIRLEFPAGLEYDLFARLQDGTSYAYVAGSNHTGPLVTQFGLDGTGHGGYSEVGAENLEGLTTPDCGGYTVDVASAITPGGAVTVKYWLGEATYVPE